MSGDLWENWEQILGAESANAKALSLEQETPKETSVTGL